MDRCESAASRLRNAVHLLPALRHTGLRKAAPAEPEHGLLDRESAQPPPKLLSEDQMKQFVVDGYLQLSVDELGDAFHSGLYKQICAGWDRDDPITTDRHCFPKLPALAKLTASSTMRGALQSILGPGYGQHPHRTMHTRPEGSAAQGWHKDGHHVPLRSHHPRWVICFYYPGDTTIDMGATGIMPGAVYSTVDRTDKKFNHLGDRLEDHNRAESVESSGEPLTARASRQGTSASSTRGQSARDAEQLAIDELGAFSARQIECKGGTVLCMSYNIFHRAGARLLGSKFRPMFKLQFYRCVAPVVSLRPKSMRGTFAYTEASLEQQAIWESIYCWMMGGQECVASQHPTCQSDTDVKRLAACITASSTTEIVRVGSAYILGQAVALQRNPVATTALSTLLELLQHPRNVVARSAMHGLTNCGNHAVDSLCSLLEDTNVQWTQVNSAGVQPQPMEDLGKASKMLDIIALVCHALGEAVQHPTERVVEALAATLNTTLTILDVQIHRVVDMQHQLPCQGQVDQTPIRTGVNDGRSDGRGPDRCLSLAVRAVSTVMDVLGMVAERVVAMTIISLEVQRRLVAQICDAVLPVSLRPDPALRIPGNVLSHSNSRFWLAEAAAYCVLRLVSSGSTRVQTSTMQVVALTCPAHHSDQRYAPALCLGAVGRLRELMSISDNVPAPVMDLLPRLEEAERGWASMAADASVDNPEPWLPGMHGVEWQ